MIAYLYLKATNTVIVIVDDVQTITSTDILGSSDTAKGVNFDTVGVLCVEEAILQDDEPLIRGDILSPEDHTDHTLKLQILNRLQELDAIIDRKTEQVYIDCDVTPSYQPMLDALIEKTALRDQLQLL